MHLEYEALSYVWGTLTKSSPIQLWRHNKNKSIATGITPSLDLALRTLRSESKTRAIWADAICINQYDDQERGQQIGLMRDVYAFAKGVIASLGPATTATAIGMEVLSFLAGSEDFGSACPWERHAPTLLCEGLNDVLSRSYFSRIWVVQEATVARKVDMMIGDYQVSWQRGATALRFLLHLKFAEISPRWEQADLRSIDMRPLREVLEQNVKDGYREEGVVMPPNLLDMAHDMRHRVATDPRDMIFALLSLAPNGIDFASVIDYTLPKEEIYRRFFEQVEGEYLRKMAELRIDRGDLALNSSGSSCQV